MSKRRKRLYAVLIAIILVAGVMLNRETESKTALCMTLLGPRIVRNAEVSVANGQITISSPGASSKIIVPVEACMIITETQ